MLNKKQQENPTIAHPAVETVAKAAKVFSTASGHRMGKPMARLMSWRKLRIWGGGGGWGRFRVRKSFTFCDCN